jgi:hypothetical protein
MSKRRVLSFKPQPRLERRGQDGQNETEKPDHPASLGDSVTSSTRTRFSVHTGRNFLRGVLEDACRAIGADSQIDEAHRDLTVDSHTQGAPGHPPIVETILRKIDAARVFVADMTFVAARPAGGRSPNPNVLIEYGWALKTHTHERIILVMNTAYGEASGEALPFDLRASRWPMQYHLPEDATPETKVEVKRRLTKELTAAIRACLQTLADAPAPPRRVPFTDLRAWAL